MKIEIHEGFPEIEVHINCPSITGEILHVKAILESRGRRLPGIRDGRTCFVDMQDVLYFESVDKRCFMYTAGEVYETPLKLYEVEECCPDGDFFRSSKSQVVNISKIASLCPDFGGRIEAKLNNGESLIVSRQYAKHLKERLGLK